MTRKERSEAIGARAITAVLAWQAVNLELAALNREQGAFLREGFKPERGRA